MQLEDFIGRIIEAYSRGDYYEEAKSAKNEFFQVAGQVAEGSEAFESRLNNFLDWYIFERPLHKQDLPPVKAFLFDHAKDLNEAEKSVFEDLTKSRSSVFELLKIKDKSLHVLDLFDKKKYTLEDFEMTGGFTKGDIFQCRLVQFQGRFMFNNAFVFHPAESKKFIQKQIKKVRYLRESHRQKLMHALSTMKQKSEQYAHIDVKHIYCEEPIL